MSVPFRLCMQLILNRVRLNDEDRYLMTRFTRHIAVFSFSAALISIIFFLLDSTDYIFMLSMATAYTGLFLIAVTLAIGPLNYLANRSNPVSSYLRRDIGIWAGIISVSHVIFGLQVHFSGEFWRYFVDNSVTGGGYSLRFDAFGLANYSGLVVTLICLVLLALSNNVSIRKLGSMKWKNIQRFNYASFPLVVGHGFIYHLLENRPLSFVMVIGLVFIGVAFLQWKGFRLHASRSPGI